MNSVCILLLLSLLQQPSSVASDSIYAEVQKQISSNRSHVGDVVEMIVLEETHVSSVAVAIPAGAKLSGRILTARKRSADSPAMVSVSMEEATWKAGHVTLNARISRLELMGMRRREQPVMPYLRGAGPVAVPSAAANFEDDPAVVPKDCRVEAVEIGAAHTAVVCRKREVELKRGARVYLTQTGPGTN
jgi:hypothetical protein